MPINHLAEHMNKIQASLPPRDLLLKAAGAFRRGQVEGIETTVDQIVTPRFNYEILWKYGVYNPILRKVIDAIIKECMRGGPRGEWYEIQKRFTVKCDRCNVEYQKEVDVCEQCKGPVRKPSELERKILEEFCKHPAPNRTLKNFVQSLLRYMLTLDDYWLHLQRRDALIGDQHFAFKFVEVKDSRFMRVAMDDNGRMGKDEYFCPKCWNLDHNDIYTRSQIEKGQQCKRCQGPLEQTWYVEVKKGSGTQIVDRFGEHEIIHDMCDPQYPYPYGNPKPVAVLFELRCVAAQNMWNLVTQTEGKIGQFIVFEGLTQPEVNDLMRQAKDQIMAFEHDPAEGITARRVRSFGIGNPRGGINAINTMPDPSKMQMIEWRRQWAEEMAGLYGVTAIFTGVVEAPHYRQSLQIDVQNNTTLKYQHEVEEPMNNVVIPWLGVNDWSWHFRPLEEKDELAENQLYQVQLAVLDHAYRLGLHAELTVDGELKVYGTPNPPMGMTPMVPGAGPGKPQPDVPLPEIPDAANIKSTPRKKTWLVKEVT